MAEAQEEVEQAGVSRADDVWMMDVDAFAPRPQGHIKVRGVEYPIFHFLDVPIEDSFRVQRISEDMANLDTLEARMERSVEQIILLNGPADESRRLTKEHFKKIEGRRSISPRQIIMLTVLASQVAHVPLRADRQESAADGASQPPSPESAASTPGGSGSSSA